MNDPFYFDFRDVFRAARIGLSAKKMWVLFLSLLLAHVIYLILGYVALLASGFSLQTIWQSYGLFPVAVVDQFAWYNWVIYGLALFFCVVIFLFASAIVARISYEQLKGDEFYTAGDAFRFARRHWKAVVVTPFSFVAIIAFVIVCGIILGLAARIPYVGELGFSILLIPIVLVSLCIVLTGVVTMLSLVLGPAIVATTGEDTMETIIQNFSTLWSQPWRLGVYEAILATITTIGSYILSLLTFCALVLIYWVCGLLMGPKMAHITSKALQYVPTSCPFFENFTDYFWSPKIAHWLPAIPLPQKMGITGEIAAVISGLFLVVIVWGVASYAWSSVAVGQAIIYLILRKKKDDDNLLERDEEEGERPEKVEEEPTEPKPEPEGEEKESTDENT